jgi:Alpha/beta hydrolase domain
MDEAGRVTGPVEGDAMRLVTDNAGIARGGIRTGWVDVPVAALSGLPPDRAPVFAMILGTTRVFGEAELTRRYPGGRAEYAAAFRAATSQAVADGFVLAEDADEMVAVAAAGYPVGVP